MSIKRRVTNLENKKRQTMPEILSPEQWKGLSLEQMARNYQSLLNALIRPIKPYGANITPEEAERMYWELMR